MFEKKIKKLPVIKQNRLVGLVSLTDIARSQPEVKDLTETPSDTRHAEEHQKGFRVLYCLMKPFIKFANSLAMEKLENYFTFKSRLVH